MVGELNAWRVLYRESRLVFSDVSLILWVSVILQCIAVIFALRLISLTSRSLAWFLLSLAFFLMATQRAISLLYREGLVTSEWLIALTTESVALVISLLLVVGVFLIRDIFTHIQKDEIEIRKLSQTVEQNPNGTLILDISGKIEYANPAYCALYGYSYDKVIGKFPDVLKPEKTPGNILKELWNTLKSGNTWDGEFYHEEKSIGRWEKVCISPVKNEQGQTTNYIVILEDITKQKKQHAEMEYMAMHDALTGLPNRIMLTNLLVQEIIRAGGKRESIAVILMDSNNFKEVNDKLGHSTGDIILKELGNRLKSCVDERGIVARMGGDEFLILLPSTNYEECLKIVSRVTTSTKTPFIFGGISFEIGFSIGISIYPDDSEDHNTLLKQAEIAMYAAKNSARKFLRFEKQLSKDNLSTLELASEIRKAVDNDEFLLLYQPKINFTSGEVDSVEALIRWQHPKRGLLEPVAFIPLAEQSEHIILITRWVIHNSLKKLSEWHKAGHKLGISINISARDLLNPELPDIIKKEIKINKIEPSRLTLEITENVIMMYSQQTMDTLNKLMDIGIRFSIDDFGTGYSSLQHLKELPLSELKIDKSFILNMTENDDDAIIVRSTIDLAHNLGLKVVAEGIEEKDVYDILHILRCDYGQGFLFKKPMTEEDLLKYL